MFPEQAPEPFAAVSGALKFSRPEARSLQPAAAAARGSHASVQMLQASGPAAPAHLQQAQPPRHTAGSSPHAPAGVPAAAAAKAGRPARRQQQQRGARRDYAQLHNGTWQPDSPEPSAAAASALSLPGSAPGPLPAVPDVAAQLPRASVHPGEHLQASAETSSSLQSSGSPGSQHTGGLVVQSRPALQRDQQAPASAQAAQTGSVQQQLEQSAPLDDRRADSAADAGPSSKRQRLEQPHVHGQQSDGEQQMLVSTPLSRSLPQEPAACRSASHTSQAQPPLASDRQPGSLTAQLPSASILCPPAWVIAVTPTEPLPVWCSLVALTIVCFWVGKVWTSMLPLQQQQRVVQLQQQQQQQQQVPREEQRARTASQHVQVPPAAALSRAEAAAAPRAVIDLALSSGDDEDGSPGTAVLVPDLLFQPIFGRCLA